MVLIGPRAIAVGSLKTISFALNQAKRQGTTEDEYKKNVLQLFSQGIHKVPWKRQHVVPWHQFKIRVETLLQEEPSDRGSASAFLQYLEEIDTTMLGLPGALASTCAPGK